MSNRDRPEVPSPFHRGELAIQERVGVRERIDAQGRRFIRPYLTEQHRQFYPQLPFVVVGSVSDTAQIWASILVGKPGFLSAPDERTLRVGATPLFGDPLRSGRPWAKGHPSAYWASNCTPAAAIASTAP